jgi:hypothetical protein
MKVECPSCHGFIPAVQMNVAADTAVCDICQEAFSLSAIVAAGADTGDFDIDRPPAGAYFEQTMDGWRLRSTTRSKMAWFLVPFMCVWSGFSLGGIYGSQIIKGEFDLSSSLFGIPFLLGTIIFGSLAVMTVCGQVVVENNRGQGTIFTGAGPIGWTRRFDWSDVEQVKEDFGNYGDSNRAGRVISLMGQNRTNFGSLLTDERRYYVLQALRKLLAERKLDTAGRFT